MSLLLYCVASVAVCAVVGRLVKSHLATPPKLFGVYAQPGPLQWFKAMLFRALVRHRRRKTGGRSGSTAGLGVPGLAETEKEQTQKLTAHPKAIDAVYFNGASAQEEVFVVAALARRPRGVFNAILYVRHPSLGLLQLPRMPDTVLFGSEGAWEAEGLAITPVTAMKKWTIRYDGRLRKSDAMGEPVGGLLDAKLDLEFTANFPHYDFDTDMNDEALSRSMAKETWSREYFKDLQEAHQTHYEQMGRLKGQLVLERVTYPIDLLSMRDHSYGVKREWRLLHRYALHMFHTKEGTQFNVGVVSQPITCSNLELGYICRPSGNKFTTISAVNFDLWQHGEAGTPPPDYAFSFQEGGKTHYVEVQILDKPVLYIGWEWEARIVECFAKFKLDGVEGCGVVEYQYNGGPGDHRPQEYAKHDPEWTKTLNKG